MSSCQIKNKKLKDLEFDRYCSYCLKTTKQRYLRPANIFLITMNIITLGFFSFFYSAPKNNHISCVCCGYCSTIPFVHAFLKMNVIRDFFKIFIFLFLCIFIIRTFLLVYFLF